jgi:hypothetical protein
LIQYDFNDSAPEAMGSTASNSGTLSGADLDLDGVGTLATSDISWSGLTPGGSGAALRFSGAKAASHAQGSPAPLVSSLTKTDSMLLKFTITMWVKLTSQALGADRLLSVGATDATHGFELRINAVTGGTTQASLSLGVNNSHIPARNYSATKIDMGAWTFLAVTYDGTRATDNVSFYNGGLSVMATALGSAVSLGNGAVTFDTAADNFATSLRVGSTPIAPDRTPPAIFDDIRIYDDVLTLAEIQSVQAAVIPEPSTYR